MTIERAERRDCMVWIFAIVLLPIMVLAELVRRS